ncbi:MAG: hypothetical protein ACE145_15830 [Terriglobia bacterium]
MKKAFRAGRARRVGTWVVVAGMATGMAMAQEPPAAAKSVSDSLSELQAQVRELSALLRDVRDEAARSREEIRELRRDLAATRAQVAANERAGATAAPPSAQAAPPASGDARLARLEEDHQLLAAKVEEQHQTKVESASKYRVRLSGIMLLNVFGNRGSVDNQDLPTLALPRGPLDTGGDFGATVRQTQIGLEVFGPKLGGARSSAEVQFDFFGGFPQTPDGVTAGLVRMRTAVTRLEWDRTAIVAGQDAPFISPLSPTSLASLALPAFSYAGNLWTWTPQVRVERRMALTENSSFLLQAGILDALSGEPPYRSYYRSPQAGEKSRQPAYATRLSWSRGPSDRSLTLGIGAYYARQNWGLNRTVDAWAGTADWNLPLGRWFALSGEFYRGRALGGLGGGTGRSVAASGPIPDPATLIAGLDTVGGWGQLKFAPTEKLELNAAFGQDNPMGEDLLYYGYAYGGTVGRNRAASANFIYRPRSNLLFSVEYRRLRTFDLLGPDATADHVNVGMGVLF